MDFDINQSLGYHLSKANSLIRLSLNQLINSAGLASSAEQWGLLNHIRLCPGMTQTELAERSSKDRTNITRMLDVLEREGRIERRADPSDRRSHRVYITAIGLELLEALAPLAFEANSRAVRGFSQDELDKFKDMMNRVLINLKENL